MDVFDKKYGFKINKKIIAFHKRRRMFCVFENKLYIAKKNLPYSHATWFEKEKWISKNNDKLMGKIVRGYLDDTGHIYFYSGFNFKINKNIETIFFAHLKELSKKLKLKLNAKIFGGFIRKNDGKMLPQKGYGTVKDNLMIT